MQLRTVSSSAATFELTDAILKCNCAANAISVQLHPSREYVEEVTIKKVESSANAVTITPYGTETIDGSASITLTALNEKKTLVAVDGGWSVVDNVTDVGAASATSINNVTITAPATSATLTIADGKTATFSNSITISGTDDKTLNIGANNVTLTTSGATTVTLPTTGTLGTLSGTETFTNKTLTSPKVNEDVAVTATATELNLLDGSTAGTTVASKALVVGANKEVDVLALPVSGLKIGAGAGTAVDRTAAEINLLAQGVAAGYKVARGTHTPTTASDTIVTGLATVVSVAVSFKGAPSLTHMFNYGDIGDQAGTPAAGSFLLKSSKPTGTGDVTPIDSTTPWSVCDWIAIGT